MPRHGLGRRRAATTGNPATLTPGEISAEESARQAVADAAIGQWRQAAEADPALAGGAATLEVHWTRSAVGSSPGHGSAGITALAARLRQGSSGRLIVLEAAGSGKTTVARLLVAELLKQAQPGDQVPVLLPVSAWNPDREGLYEWIGPVARG